MHDSSYSMMQKLLNEFARRDAPLRVLDVGSMNVNGSYRTLISPKWMYIGSDIRPGPGVDMIQSEPYHIQDAADDYDIVISGQCLEHVEHPWLLVPEIARVLKPRGVCILAAPWKWDVHTCPIDCWRILPDGMRVLLRLANLTSLHEPFINGNDCWGVARK